MLECERGNYAHAALTKEDVWHRRYEHLAAQGLRHYAHTALTKEDVWHRRYGHLGAQGKHHRSLLVLEGREHAGAPLELIHCDVCGKVNARSLGGAKYFLTFIDDSTRYTWVYLLKRKDEVFKRLVEWKAMVEKSSGRKVKVLRSDNGGEYTGRELQDYLKREGVRHELTVPKTPKQNGVAEQMNRTLLEMVRTMLIESNLDHRFWG